MLDQPMASLEPVDRRVEHRRQKEGDDEPANERAYLPEEEERAQHHHCGEQGNGHRAHDLRSRGAYPPSILAGHGRVLPRRYHRRFCLGFCLRLCLRVPLCGLFLVHISSPYCYLGCDSSAAQGRLTIEVLTCRASSIWYCESFSPWSGQLADRSRAISRPLLLLGEGLAQLVLLLLGQVGGDDLEVILL